jgi:hypothetical protein
MSFCKNCGRWKIYDCIFEFSVKIYVRNKINLSRTKILFPSVITHLEQVVTQWNAISLQLFYGSTIYTPVCLFRKRIIHKSLRYVRPLHYSSRDCHAEGEHVNRGRDTVSFCPTLQLLHMSFCCVCQWRSRPWWFPAHCSHSCEHSACGKSDPG